MSTRSAPEYALSFSSEAVHLMERAGSPAATSIQWKEKAVAAFDAPDFRAEMTRLHKLAANGPDARVALIIPDDQILYTSLPVGEDVRRTADLGRALDGLTPYPVADLAWDWRPEGAGDVRVAAVARQTLREAEDFARRHGFAAEGFLADPPEGVFPATPQFGGKDWTSGAALGDADLPGDAVQDVAAASPPEVAEAPTDSPAKTAGSASADDHGEVGIAALQDSPAVQPDAAASVAEVSPAPLSPAGPPDADEAGDVGESTSDNGASAGDTGDEEKRAGRIDLSPDRPQAEADAATLSETPADSLAAEPEAGPTTQAPAPAEAVGELPPAAITPAAADTPAETRPMGSPAQPIAPVAVRKDARPEGRGASGMVPTARRPAALSPEQARVSPGRAPIIPEGPAVPSGRHPGARGGVGALLVMLGALLLGLVLIWAFATPGPGDTQTAGTPSPDVESATLDATQPAARTTSASAPPAAPPSAQPSASSTTTLEPAQGRPAATVPPAARTVESTVPAGVAAVPPAADAAQPVLSAPLAGPSEPPPSSAAPVPEPAATPAARATSSNDPANAGISAVPTAPSAPDAANVSAAPTGRIGGPAGPREEPAVTSRPGAREPAAFPAGTSALAPNERPPAQMQAAPSTPTTPTVVKPAANRASAEENPAATRAELAAAAPAAVPAARPSEAPSEAPAERAEAPSAAAPVAPTPVIRPSNAPRRPAPAAAPSASQADPLPAVVPGRSTLTRSERPSSRPAAAPAQPSRAAEPARAAAPGRAPSAPAPAASRPAAPPRPEAAPRAAAQPQATSALPVSSARPRPRPEEGSADESVTAAEMTPQERVAADSLLSDLYAATPWLPRLSLPAGAEERYAESRPSRRPGSGSAVDAAIAEAVAAKPAAARGDRPAKRAAAKPAAPAEAASAPVRTAANTRGRPVARPARGTTPAPSAVEAALAEAVGTNAGAEPATMAAAASLVPVRKPARVTPAVPETVALAAATTMRPRPDATAPVTAPAMPPAASVQPAPAEAAQRLRDEGLQRQAEERARQSAAADARADLQARAAAEARARAQAEAEERAAIAARGSYRPPEVDDEPEIAQKPVEGRTAGDVAKNATVRGIELNKTQVIGVIGAGRASRGLIRLRNGKIVTVRLGDRIDGGAINSIGNGKISYVKGGRTYNLPILNGR
ncbi:hypothetical protein [Paracoccus sp. MC1862]|uniref:hypothetical protein n=1 Tax=Paracoccus sp. MC1862 TaxID=2760307 RepID=UPI0015FFFD05|nr:hypothetical protein [Paracoccus sp. MC1862]MBB1496901.1 hypothetical protein [Paracoccus sp. MC1862]QQO45523.1 hypothetical protein JGR78_04015 [Paracoccus sp. MC1862]